MVDEEVIALRYEPQVALGSGALVGAEAIAFGRGKGMLETRLSGSGVSRGGGMPVSLGEWTLRRACLEAARWQREGAGAFRITVKVAAQELQFDTYTDAVRALLRESGLDPDRLELELQEGAALSQLDAISPTLARLKSLGVQIALGGFGRTRSPLGLLQRLGCDRIKIHPSFLTHSGTFNRLPVARAMIDLARNLRMGTVAEGVESKRCADLLAEYGCGEGQGSYFGGALTSSAFAAGLWVAATKAGRWTVPAPWVRGNPPRESLTA
jgi:EAL domain-containing protein (putative c-di-GMP-specific phosphodiesterase class I)